MSKAENYIRDYTKRCSNAVEGCNQDAYYSEGLYQPWLTPENALAAVEIERQEVIDEIEDVIYEFDEDDPIYSKYMAIVDKIEELKIG